MVLHLKKTANSDKKNKQDVSASSGQFSIRSNPSNSEKKSFFKGSSATPSQGAEIFTGERMFSFTSRPSDSGFRSKTANKLNRKNQDVFALFFSPSDTSEQPSTVSRKTTSQETFKSFSRASAAAAQHAPNSLDEDNNWKLPNGWTKYFNNKSGKHYYHKNNIT